MTAAQPANADRLVFFRGIYDRELDYVWRTLRRLGVRAADIEDVAQEVFLAVYRRLDDYDSTRPMRSWLFGFAFRTASEHRRRHGISEELTDEPIELEDDAPLADRLLESEEERAFVLRALESMELGRRAVFIMHEIDGQPIPEVAKTLDVPLNTAYSRLRLAREDFIRAVTRLQAAARHAATAELAGAKP